ncbi:DUF2946 domain-containing protein [Epibacterium ulvae]|uniref:DUF2946 domain-containing protein n=1 Tax=Epibacterium ulvae TaxID=1156985 RepID=UPI0024934E0F|nr:DUF2946 domain-containing protein [Epibacterium ulvae]
MLHRLSSFLLLIALAVAGMIPAGWMPETGEDGRILLVLCTDDGVVEQWVNLGDDEASDPHSSGDPMEDRSCPFVALNGMAALDGDVSLINPATLLTARWGDQPFTHTSAGFYTRYDARGPPAYHSS